MNLIWREVLKRYLWNQKERKKKERKNLEKKERVSDSK